MGLCDVERHGSNSSQPGSAGQDRGRLQTTATASSADDVCLSDFRQVPGRAVPHDSLRMRLLRTSHQRVSRAEMERHQLAGREALDPAEHRSPKSRRRTAYSKKTMPIDSDMRWALETWR